VSSGAQTGRSRTDGVAAGLRAAAALFGEPASTQAPSKYAPLVDQAGRPADLPLAIELVYEGYLLHYRTSRALVPGDPAETLLLAGDYFYAHGLRLVARTGDMGAVALLTRLMAACSFLRVQQAALATDDDLWELTAFAVGAGDGPCRVAATGVYDHFEGLIAASRTADLPAAAAAGLTAVRTCAAQSEGA
jgi:hypothetical protein